MLIFKACLWPHCRLTPDCYATPSNISMNLIGLPPESRLRGLHFCRWQYASIFFQIFVAGSERRTIDVAQCVLTLQGHRRSMIFVSSERASCIWILKALSWTGRTVQLQLTFIQKLLWKQHWCRMQPMENITAHLSEKVSYYLFVYKRLMHASAENF